MNRPPRTIIFVALLVFSIFDVRQVRSADGPKAEVPADAKWMDAAHTTYATDLHGAYDSIHVSPVPNPVTVAFLRFADRTSNPPIIVLTLTNGRAERILFHDVRVQALQTNATAGVTKWKTLTEDYPNSDKSDVEPKGRAEFRVTDPGCDELWHVAVVYSVEQLNPSAGPGHRTFATNYEAVSGAITNLMVPAATPSQ